MSLLKTVIQPIAIKRKQIVLWNRLPRSLILALTLLVVLLSFVLIVNYYERKILDNYIRQQHRFEQRAEHGSFSPSLANKGKGAQGSISEHSNTTSDLIVIYNRVPKTGSTSFMGIAYELCTINHFHVMHLNISKNSHVMSLADQRRFVWNVTGWTEMQPALIHGHVAFLDFSKYGVSNIKPLYINIVRKPLDRLVSYYYFLRNGDNFRPNIVRKKQGDKKSFDECYERRDHDCREENLWLQIPFFCGQFSECWQPGSAWALDRAKQNVIDHYFLVGTTESLRDFIAVLDASLPQMFRGAVDIFDKGTKSHLRKTFNKMTPNSRTIAKIQQSKVWQMENEFYQFVVDNFNFIRDKTLIKDSSSGSLKEIDQQFFFEKIRPK